MEDDHVMTAEPETLQATHDVIDVRKEIEYVHTILDHGTSADRQIATFRKTGDLKAVVDQIVQETIADCD